jgi:guanidinopropionase
MAEDSHYPDPMNHPRYTGIATFMRAAYAEDWSEVDVGLAGIPFDGGVTNRTGARHGPREMRNQSSMLRKINQASRLAPYDLCRVADIGDAWVRSPFHLETSLDEIAEFFTQVHAAGVVPISAGGDHSVTLPVFRGIAAEHPVGMVHIDAHCDTGDDYLGSKFHHGAPFRRAVEEGLLDPKRTVQIGIRGPLNDIDIWNFSHETGMRVIYMEEFYELGVKAVIDEARRVVGDGTPEVGGLTTIEGQALLRGLRGLDLVGGDVVEVAPPFDPTGNTALVGATMMFEILCVVADAVAARKARRDAAE